MRDLLSNAERAEGAWSLLARLVHSNESITLRNVIDDVRAKHPLEKHVFPVFKLRYPRF